MYVAIHIFYVKSILLLQLNNMHWLFVYIFNSRPSGTDKEFFMQLFVGPDENVPMPDTYWLLHKTFKDENITFKEVCT